MSISIIWFLIFLNFLGTGTNACYTEKLENVELWDGDFEDPQQVRLIIITTYFAFLFLFNFLFIFFLELLLMIFVYTSQELHNL